MWRRHQAVLSTQRWLLRGHYPRTSVGNQCHQLSTLRSLGGAASYASTDKLVLQKPSLQLSSPSLTRYGHVHQRISHPLLISCHAYSNQGYNRPRSPRMGDMNSVEEVIVTAYEYLDVMSRSDISALWTRIVQLISKRQPRQRRTPSTAGEMSFEDMEYMLYTIFDNTTDGIEDCNVRELTTIILGMAKIVKILRQQGNRRGEDSCRVMLRRLLINKDKKPNRDLFKFLANASVDKLHQFDARHISNLAYAYALIGYVPEFDDGRDLFDHVASYSIEFRADFDSQGFSNTVWAYATVDKPHGALFEKMGDEIAASKNLNEFRPQALSNAAWAYATAGINHPILFETVANHIVETDSLNRFNPQALANTLWAYAAAGVNHPRLFEAVASHIVQSGSLDRFNPQDLSNTVWAYATAGINHPKLFDRVANHIVESSSLDRFNPQELSNTVWAYASAGIYHPKLFAKVASHIVETDCLDRFKPQNLANTVWAYATAGIYHPRLFGKVANHIVETSSLDRFKPQNLTNTVWAYATAGINHPKLFEAVASHIVESSSLDRFDPQAFSNTVWAYATVGVNHPRLFAKVASHIVETDCLGRFKPQNLSNTVWAYATAGIYHPELFERVAATATQRKDLFNPQNVANLLWAYATLGNFDKQLFLPFVPTATILVDSFNNQDLANIAWAYAAADVDAPTLFNDTFIKTCVEKKSGFQAEELRQLNQWHLWQTREKSNAGLPLDLCDSCYEAFISRVLTVSKLQDDVVSQLTSISLDPREEVLLSSGYCIDAIVEVNGKTVGVEVDGPSHFLGKGRSPTGSTILKRRQVSEIDGLELVSVPYWEWDKLLGGKDEVKRQEYLRKLLGLSKDN